MDEKKILGRNYEFENNFFKEPRKYGGISLFQMGELCCECGYEIEPHVQPCHEISVIVSGEGFFIVNGVRYPVTEGDLFLNQKGELHAIESSSQRQLRYLYMGFDFVQSSGIASGSQPEAIEELSAFFCNPFRERKSHDKLGVMSVFLKMLGEVYNGSVFSEQMIDYYLHQVLILSYRTFHSDQKASVMPKNDVNVVGSTVYSVIKYIDNNILEIDTVKSIAGNLGYSYVYLSHLFRNKTGMTLQSYVNYKKIEKSLELIGDGKLSITQTALMLNFDTVQSFSKAFKRTLGFSPTKYRKKMEQEQPIQE